MIWEDLQKEHKIILLIAYAAKMLNLNGNGSITQENIFEIISRDNLLKADVEELRMKLKNNIPECRKLIYGVIN